jgi:protein-disulfide isomerase-like protein with CxxC motif
MLKLLHLLSLLKRLKRKQKSFLNSAMKSDLGSELFEERIKLKKEADQELALQMLRRRMRKMQDSGVPSVIVEGRTRKRSIQESKDSFEEIERQERV